LAMRNEMTGSTKPKYLVLYLVLAYGIAWALWIPVILSKQDYQSSPILLATVLMGVFGPGIAGIVVTSIEGGRNALRDFWRRAFDFHRIRPVWYPIMLLFWPALLLLAIGLSRLLGGESPGFEFVRELAAQPAGILIVVLLYFVQAGLEELGWRGYMLERLQKTMTPVRASLIVWIFHALWHFPFFFILGTNQYTWGFGIDFWLFFAFVLAGSVYSTWCYNDNGRSTLAATLLHTTANLSLDIFNAPGTQMRVYTLLLLAGAVVVGLVWLREKR
jgi:membrane protease YdiL (CAAX protease family)